MTDATQFIAGDWGTSNLRLYLCEFKQDGTSRILDTRHGPGINQINADFEDRFFNLCQDWLEQFNNLPVFLSGMIGSNIGWKEAPYLNCPVSPEEIANGRIQFKARGISFSILAGLRTQNPLGMPDIMRGEELQMLGWLALQKTPPSKQLFTLPGTHNKWALIESGVVSNFLTAFTGELFDILRNNSILISDHTSTAVNEDIFISALQAIENMGDAQLVHALFSTRSKQVLGEIASTDALSYLSGLIIGADVKGAQNIFGKVDGVTIIGETNLSKHYSLALQHFGINSHSCDPGDIAIAGFDTIFRHLNNNPLTLEKHADEYPA